MNELKLVDTSEIDIKRTMVKVMALVGFRPQNITDPELDLICNYVKKHFRNLKLSEIQQAFEMGIAGTFEIDLKTYQTFSALYVSDLLKAYKSHVINLNRNGAKEHIESETMKALPFNEIKDHTEKALKLYRLGKDTKGARWTEIYNYLKQEGKINIPKDEYKILMFEIKDEIQEEIKTRTEEKKNYFDLEMCLKSKMMFHCECLKRVVLRYFDELLLNENK